jgi:hypothetical protein
VWIVRAYREEKRFALRSPLVTSYYKKQTPTAATS